MNNVTSYKYFDWDFNKSAYGEIDSFPLMQTPGPVLLVLVAYLAFVKRIGPNYMSLRDAFKLQTTMLIYNTVQVAFSAYIVQQCFRVLYTSGLAPKHCPMDNDSIRSKILYCMWIYLMAKFSELLDTVFFILRKKNNQVTFLHLYHHSIMLISTWALLKYWPSHTIIYIGFINSVVHIFMYTYYGLAGLGPSVAKYLTWKKYITSLQIMQFLSVIVQFPLATTVSECPIPKGYKVFITCNTIFFLFLFSNFYVKSYIKKKNI